MNKINILEVNFNFDGQVNTIYPVILEDENEIILIDCGYPDFLHLIEQIAIKDGIDIKKLSKIIITHHDFDHMGTLAEFKRKYPNIQILASKEDEPYISGKKKSLRLKQAEAMYHSLSEKEKEKARDFHKMLESVEPCNVDICLNDKDYFHFCGGIEIISTPGHMPGHISVYVKENKTLISGDALVIENECLNIALPKYTLDIEKAKESVKKLLSYDIDRIICYHGGVYTGDIKKALQAI
ncbi:MBL fold metallo-hydrolase [Clostridium tetanomorphum]|uniref:MBL fold metallo-hydrolase n=1 Tax=Clostridium tetanomorphum TaxID=1553 RepID=A0A923E901_CLOTT|nr:MBL fold metallo-hydrolase [Clostridium tetanomorphum]MBC2398683.1 MBL fold metallo-hydrolase [Clostridium tetanomorphum]NRZ97663.1 glyoxylase-like metal-dependent hydrolase (beta-lactamase superfamily II) [Clostridium tetanomorphum]